MSAVNIQDAVPDWQLVVGAPAVSAMLEQFARASLAMLQQRRELAAWVKAFVRAQTGANVVGESTACMRPVMQVSTVIRIKHPLKHVARL